MGQRPALIAGDLAEEEVLRLDGGGAFVERVDLGIADVLLDRVILQEARAAEGLQRFGQALVGALGSHPPLTIGSSRSLTRSAIASSAPDTMAAAAGSWCAAVNR